MFSTPEAVPLDGSTARCSVGVVGEAACWCGTVAEEALFQQRDTAAALAECCERSERAAARGGQPAPFLSARDAQSCIRALSDVRGTASVVVVHGERIRRSSQYRTRKLRVCVRVFAIRNIALQLN